MSAVFGADYAAAYDALYGDKDYEAECDLVERLAREYADEPIGSVLDLGCGTGGHALVLAARGYEVTGVDRSEEMLAEARRKAAGTVVFHHGDVRTFDLGRRFDLAVMLFAVLGYLGGDDDVRAALTAARRHLRPGRLLVFDVWYEPAVLALRPSERTKEVESPSGRIVRRSSAELDVERRICTVRFHVAVERDGVRRETEEEHEMRYFSEADLARLLRDSGFELARLGAFPDVERDPDATTWSVVAAARAR